MQYRNISPAAKPFATLTPLTTFVTSPLWPSSRPLPHNCHTSFIGVAVYFSFSSYSYLLAAPSLTTSTAHNSADFRSKKRSCPTTKNTWDKPHQIKLSHNKKIAGQAAAVFFVPQQKNCGTHFPKKSCPTIKWLCVVPQQKNCGTSGKA